MPQIETSGTASTVKHLIRMGLAVWMLIGGLQGLWIMRGGQWFLFASATTFFALGFYILFFAGNVVAAWMLWKTPRRGLRLTFVLQILALLRFQGPQVKHVLASLYGAWLTQTENGIVFLRNAGSCFAFSAESSFGTAGTRSVFDGPIYFGVNLVAIAIGVLAWVLLHATRQNQEEVLTE